MFLSKSKYGIRYVRVRMKKGARTAFVGGEDVFRRVEERLSFIFSGSREYFWRQP
jgi:hypothetical protein